MQKPREILKEVFGYDDFRTGQLDIIEKSLSTQTCASDYANWWWEIHHVSATGCDV